MSTIAASCHCGAVQIRIAAAPPEVTECNCSICRRYGARWAYYSAGQVAFPSPDLTEAYSWDDRSIAFHRCRRCGCVSHWVPLTRSEDRIGVNARLIDPADLAGARVRHLDGAVSEQYLD